MNTEYLLDRDEVQHWAVESLRDSLALSFSRMVAVSADWEKATFRTFAKVDLPNDAILDFRVGGKTDRQESADNWVVESVNCGRDRRDSFFLIEDWRPRKGSKFIMDTGMPAVFYDEEVYYVVKADDPRTFPSWRRIFSNSVPLFHGFVIQGEPMPAVGDVLQAALMQALARKVFAIIFGIYDGESYLLCSFWER